MSEFSLAPGDQYDKQCGEVFITLNGCIIFHCSLCGSKYKGVNGYVSHIIEKHFEPACFDDDVDCISNNSSTHSMFERKEEIKEEIYEALEEEEITIEEIKEKKTSNKLVTAVPVLDEDENSITIKWEEQLLFEPERQMTKKRKISPPPVQTKLKQPQTHAPKPISEAEILRLANEEALLKNNGKLVYEQPPARGRIPDSERKHRCNFCGFAFRDPSNLLAHIKRHSQKKQYQCAYCPKMFYTRTEIEEHSRRHTGERPHNCEYENCTKTFYTKGELNAHIKRHLNQRDFKCEICGRSFYDKSDLKEHSVAHTQERKHDCIVCNAKFSRRKALLNHMKLHENKREYECELCGACFNQRPGLSSHLRSKHKQ